MWLAKAIVAIKMEARMKVEYDEEAQLNVVVLSGVETCEAVTDACFECGAVHPERDELHVRFPGNHNEYISPAELRKRLLEQRNF